MSVNNSTINVEHVSDIVAQNKNDFIKRKNTKYRNYRSRKRIKVQKEIL